MVVAVMAVAAAALDGSFWGQNFEVCPNCLQLQQRGRHSPTSTIICLSLPVITSGIACNPSLSKQIRITWSPQAVPAANFRRLLSSIRPNLLRRATSTSLVINAGTLHTVTRTLWVPMYSGCNRKNLVIMVEDAAFSACSFDAGRLKSQNFCDKSIGRGRLLSGEGLQNLLSSAQPAVLFSNLLSLVSISLVLVFP